jgi:hypothetical protein
LGARSFPGASHFLTASGTAPDTARRYVVLGCYLLSRVAFFLLSKMRQPLLATVYAPQSALSVTGGFTGALVGNSVSLNANGAACHYDEAISRSGRLPEPMPWLGPVARTSDGQVQFTINGNGRGGFPLIVEASPNLIDWMALETNTAPFVCSDPSESNFRQRFYRSVSAP